MPLTHSSYDLRIDNQLSFGTGVTAGYILAVGGNGVSYFTPPTSAGVTGPTGPAGSNGSNGATGATGSTPTDNKTFITLADAATISWTYTSGYNAKLTLGGNRNISITGATNGDYGLLMVTQGPTGSNRINFSTSNKFVTGTYSFSSVGTQSDIYTFVYDGTNYYWNYNKNFS